MFVLRLLRSTTIPSGGWPGLSAVRTVQKADGTSRRREKVLHTGTPRALQGRQQNQELLGRHEDVSGLRQRHGGHTESSEVHEEHEAEVRQHSGQEQLTAEDVQQGGAAQAPGAVNGAGQVVGTGR